MGNKLLYLIKADLKHIFRDSMMILTIIGPILLALVLKWGIPILDKELNSTGFILADYNHLILGISFMLTPMLIGSMTGLLLLEDKEQGLMQYYAVTPFTKERYLLYRLSIPIILNGFISLGIFYYTNLIELSFLKLILVILLASIEANIIALFLVSFAHNRVEGLALTKGVGIFMVFPVLELLVATPFKFLFYLSPTLYITKALEYGSTNQQFGIYVLLGILVHMLFYGLIHYKFKKTNI